MTDSENLEECWLDDAVREELLELQNECIFMWVNNAGQPFGVTMSYIWRDESFWLTCAEARKRVPAIEKTGYAAISITSKGTDLGTGKTVSYRGPCTVHENEETLKWMLPELAYDTDGKVRDLTATEIAALKRLWYWIKADKNPPVRHKPRIRSNGVTYDVG